MNAASRSVSVRRGSGRPLAIGVLGCGRIGRLHADLLAGAVPGARLAGVFDVVTEAAADVATRHGVRRYDSTADVFADGVDAVAICTSTDSHADLIVAAATAGAAIFCEKPVALDLADVDRALAAVAAAGVALHVGFNRRFDPSHAAVAAAARAGDLGTVELVRITSRDPAPPPLDYLARSGGLFADMTIHDFDMARFLAGSEVVEVFATGAALVDERIAAAGDIDTAVIVLRHESGVLTTIDNSRRAVYGYDQRVEVFGSGGAAGSDNPPLTAAWQRNADGLRSAAIGEFFLDRYAASYRQQWDDFVATVAADRPPSVDGADGRAALVLALAADESRRRGTPVTLT